MNQGLVAWLFISKYSTFVKLISSLYSKSFYYIMQTKQLINLTFEKKL